MGPGTVAESGMHKSEQDKGDCTLENYEIV